MQCHKQTLLRYGSYKWIKMQQPVLLVLAFQAASFLAVATTNPHHSRYQQNTSQKTDVTTGFN